MIFRTIFHGRRRCCSSPAPEAGFALVEVMITALLVGLIVVATFTGFDAVGHATADERYHDQAALIASQSQEALRSDPASALDTLPGKPHVYTETIGKQTFTVTQEAAMMRPEGNSTCSATAAHESKEAGPYIQITSSVKWHQQEASKRLPVSETSIITPPDGSTLEVDLLSATEPVKAIEGVTVLVKEVETTTGAAGCVTYDAIPSTTVSLEAYRAGYVSEADANKVTEGEITIAPNVTTRHTITLANGGSITGEFEYNGATTVGGKAVESDTFVVSNTELKASSTFEVGGTASTAASKHFAPTAQTIVSSPNFPTGDLFPFKSKWIAYAGDCTSNNSNTVTKNEIKDPEAAVTEGNKTTVRIPLSKLALTVYSGTFNEHGTLETVKTFPIKVTNTQCKTAIPNNATEAQYIHEQEFKEGALQYPYQPFGALELCLYNESAKKTYTLKLETKTVAGTSGTVYLSQSGSKSGKTEHSVTVKTEQSKC